MRILWIAAISVSWQFADANFFMPKFLCIPPFVAINGSCLIPTTTKPLIPPCLKNPQNSTVLPDNREIVTVSTPDFLPEDGDSIGENIAEDKETSLPIIVPTVPNENAVSTESSVNTSSPEPDDTITKNPDESDQNESNPEIIPPSKHANSSEISTNPGQETDGSKHPENGSELKPPISEDPPVQIPKPTEAVEDGDKDERLKPIVPDANKVSTESSANTTLLDPNDTKSEESDENDRNPETISPPISENTTRNKTDSESNKNIGKDLLPEHVRNQTKPSSNSSTEIPGTRPGNPPTNPKISDTDKLGNVISPPISGGSVGALPTTPIIPDTNKKIIGIPPSKIPSPGDWSIPKDPSMPEIPDTDKLINDLLPTVVPPKISLPSNPENISEITPKNHITPLPVNWSHPTIKPITGVGSETPPTVPTLPDTDNLVGTVKPPSIPPHEMPGLKPPTPPKTPDTDHLINGSLPIGDLIDQLKPPKIPKIPDIDELINGLLPSERPNQIPSPGVTGVGSVTTPMAPTLPDTDNLVGTVKPPIIPPHEIPESKTPKTPTIPETDPLINGTLPSADLIGTPQPPKIDLPEMPKIIDPVIPIPKLPKLIRPEDLYPKFINMETLLPKDITGA